MIEVHQNIPVFGLLSPVPYDGSTTKLDYKYEVIYKKGIKYDKEFKNKTYEIEFINAAAWLMSSELIRRIGGFHPKFKMYGEDNNYINRIHFNNYFKVGITMDTKYYHDRPQWKSNFVSISESRYIFNSKINSKTCVYHPNKKIFWRQLKHIIVMILKKKEKPYVNMKILIYSLILYLDSFGYRKIYFKP